MSHRLVLMILILASSVAMMSTDLYAPSLAHLPAFFHTDAATVKLTMSLNTLGYALATLVHGPLSERFGRKPVLLIGLAGFTLASFLCATSTSIGQLIGFRLLQGVTAAVEGVLVLSIISDIFDDHEQVRAMAIYGIATSLTPTVAPILGGYIHIWFGWRMNFYVLTVVALTTTLLIGRFLHESGGADPHALKPREILRDYLGILRNRDFLRFNVVGGSIFSLFFAFITAGPFILIHNYGLPTQYFGYFQGIMVIAYMFGSILAGRLTKRYSALTIMAAGVTVSTAGSILLLYLYYGGMESPATLAVALALLAFGDGPVFATTPSLAMSSTDSRTGAAAAMVVSVEIGIASLAAFSVGLFDDGTSRPFVLTCAALCTAAVIASVTATRPTAA